MPQVLLGPDLVFVVYAQKEENVNSLQNAMEEENLSTRISWLSCMIQGMVWLFANIAN